MTRHRLSILLLATVLIALLVSDIAPDDRIGHFFQGLVLALLARENFLRRGLQVCMTGRWRNGKIVNSWTN